jgi:hypothetical protein
VIRKLCLINIAAERYAGNQVAGTRVSQYVYRTLC